MKIANATQTLNQIRQMQLNYIAVNSWLIKTFFVHDSLQLVVEVVSTFGKHIGPLVTQNTQVFLLVTVQSFL